MKKFIPAVLCGMLLLASCRETAVNPEILSEVPDISPDYTEVTVPATIAPLNFSVAGSHEKLQLRAEGGKGGVLEIHTSGFISFPAKKWKQLLSENTGDRIVMTLTVKSEGRWVQYAPFSIYVSEHPIDYGLAYRLIAPGYEVYSRMGIYQRRLSDFDQQPVIENTIIPGSCMNCHSFNQTNPQDMSLHVRGKNGGTIIKSRDSMKIVDTKTDETISAGVYPYWHPSGRFVAYSVNSTLQVFHSAHRKRIEVYDFKSDIVVYDIETDELITCDQLNTSSFETFPAFSPDGKTLYFCTGSEQTMPDDYQKMRYNLCRISFDPDTRSFGSAVDTLIRADAEDKSVSFPKPSFDGKFLMYTLLDYGNFGIWHPEADLYLLNLEDGTTRAMTEVNSTHADSYHNWSSNSRWFVFGSRRMDDLYTRPYIAAIDGNGQAGKPFLLPQEHPDYYLESLYSYNVPEFINSPIEFDANHAARRLVSPEREKVKLRK